MYDLSMSTNNSNIDITTIIVSYNHEKYIQEAIESAIKQQGNFTHEILISDDCSTDKTQQIIKQYAEKYPNLIRNISNKKNIGISNNIKKCFDMANGKYIAILEGDDYWTDNRKLEKQKIFLEQNTDCSMCFSRVQILDSNGKIYLLESQKDLPSKFTGKNIIKGKNLSLIINFSTCMFISHYMKNLPEILYKHRFSEISLQFYLEQKGKIGFISSPLSIYRYNKNGVWSGSNINEKIKQKYLVRRNAYKVCANQYKKDLKKHCEKELKLYILTKCRFYNLIYFVKNFFSYLKLR